MDGSSVRKRPLTSKELAELAENFAETVNWSESEDGLDFSDTDSVADPTYLPDSPNPIEYFTSEDLLENLSSEDENENNTEDNEEKNKESGENNTENDNANLNDNEETTRKNTSRKNKSLPKRDVLWRHRGLHLNDLQLEFHGNNQLPPDCMYLDTPYSFFKYFFSNELIDRIAEESSLYATQQNPNNSAHISAEDIKQYMGICFYMSLVHLPSVRAYWSVDLGYDPIRNVMPVNKFEKIRRYIHFNDNSKHLPRENPDHDRLHKLRPLIDHLNETFRSIPLEQFLAVDEQMCATKVKHFMKQYLPMKPHKWGFKLYVLAGVSGFAYHFEIYSGQENLQTRPANEPDIGASANIVVRLARIIPTMQNYRLYFDNYYTSLELMLYLAKRGIYSLGTVRRNRIPNCKLPSEKDLKKEKRGTSSEYLTTIDGIDISSLVWKDNKYVTLLSTYAGKEPITSVKRFDKKEKRMVDVDCPSVVKEYNHHMGGVDLMDSFIGRYRIALKSRKWYIRIFYHLLDLGMVNAWLLHKKVLTLKGQNISKHSSSVKIPK